MKLIERYVYVVTSHLKEEMREDVKKELTANIMDMLPENPTDEEIKTVLEKLGNPVKLAAEYSNTKRYVIGPELYDNYVYVLKLLLSFIPAIVVAVVFLKGVLSPVSSEVVEVITHVITDMITAAFETVLQVLVWVTFIFLMLERNGVSEGKLPFIMKKWSVNDLKEVQVNKKNRISRVETIFTMIFGSIFAVIIVFAPKILGWYEKGSDGLKLVEPFFNIDRLQPYIFAIIILTIFLLCINIWKLITSVWNYPLAIANALYNFASAIFVVTLFRDKKVFNEGFLNKFASVTEYSLSQVSAAFDKILLVFMIVIIITSVIDGAKGFWKCRK